MSCYPTICLQDLLVTALQFQFYHSATATFFRHWSNFSFQVDLQYLAIQNIGIYYKDKKKWKFFLLLYIFSLEWVLQHSVWLVNPNSISLKLAFPFHWLLSNPMLHDDVTCCTQNIPKTFSLHFMARSWFLWTDKLLSLFFFSFTLKNV
jgi:hypothetical protein